MATAWFANKNSGTEPHSFMLDHTKHQGQRHAVEAGPFAPADEDAF
jgi:hypothetical protein